MTTTTLFNVNFPIRNNAWWLTAFQFGIAGDTSWSFTHKHFLCDLKGDPTQSTPDFATSSIESPPTILVLDEVQRILQFYVTDLQIRAVLQVQPYNYDLIMVDDITGERDSLMFGIITVTQGITLED